MSSVSILQDMRTGGRWFDPPAHPIFCSKIDDNHCDRISSSLTNVDYFDDDCVGKQPAA